MHVEVAGSVYVYRDQARTIMHVYEACMGNVRSLIH